MYKLNIYTVNTDKLTSNGYTFFLANLDIRLYSELYFFVCVICLHIIVFYAKATN